MAYYLGIDGGGTKTQAVILDETGQLVGVGIAGSSNFNNIGEEQACVHVGEAVAYASAEANIDAANFDAAFLGIAGVVSDEDKALVRGIGTKLHLAPESYIGIDHDCRIALAGGLAGQPGIVQIIGTGTSCFGMNADGERWLAGGWGYLIADEGSGYWMGIQAMKAVMAHYDTRGPKTILHHLVLEVLNLESASQLMHHLYVDQMSVTEIASLSRLVLDAADQGDSVALDIISHGMDEVSRSVEAVANYLNFGEQVRLVCVGGIVQAGEIITTPLYDAVLRRVPHCLIQPPQFSAAIGAGLLASQMVQPVIPPTFLQRLHASLERRN